MTTSEAIAVVTAYGSPAAAGERAARQDWQSGIWPKFEFYDFAGLLGREFEAAYRRVIDAFCVIDPEKAKKDRETRK